MGSAPCQVRYRDKPGGPDSDQENAAMNRFMHVNAKLTTVSITTWMEMLKWHWHHDTQVAEPVARYLLLGEFKSMWDFQINRHGNEPLSFHSRWKLTYPKQFEKRKQTNQQTWHRSGHTTVAKVKEQAAQDPNLPRNGLRQLLVSLPLQGPWNPWTAVPCEALCPQSQSGTLKGNWKMVCDSREGSQKPPTVVRVIGFNMLAN